MGAEADLITRLGEGPEYKSFLYYGRPGTGKTHAAASIYRKKKKLFIDVDNKLAASLAVHPDLAELRENIYVFTPTYQLDEGKIGIASAEKKKKDSETILVPGRVPKKPEGYKQVVDFVNDQLPDIIGKHGIEVVVLDTGSTLCEHLYYLILSHHKRSSFTQELWGVYKLNIAEFTKGFLSLPCHRIMIFHTYTVQDELTKEIHVTPSVQGSYKEEIGKEFTEVWYFEGVKSSGNDAHYTVRTQSTYKYVARTASGLKPSENIEDALSRFQ